MARTTCAIESRAKSGAAGDPARQEGYTARMWRRHGLATGWAVVLAAWLMVAGALVVRVPTSGSDFAAYLGAAQALRFDPHANIYQLSTLTTAVQDHGG